MCENLLFSDTLEGLRLGTYLTTFGFGVNLSGITLFDDLNREEFYIVELIPIPGGKF